MNRKTYIAIVIVTTIVSLFAYGYVEAAFGTGRQEFDSIAVGQAGVGGVTYFNGTIVNATSSNGAENPVAFGDDVRIDGRVYRGSTQGPGDGMKFIVDDDMEVTGSLTVTGNVNAANISSLSAAVNAVQGTVDASSVKATNNANAIVSLETKVTTAQNTANAATAQTAADDAQGTANLALAGSVLNYFVLSCLDVLGDTYLDVLYVDIQYCYDLYWTSSSASISAPQAPVDIEATHREIKKEAIGYILEQSATGRELR